MFFEPSRYFFGDGYPTFVDVFVGWLCGWSLRYLHSQGKSPRLPRPLKQRLSGKDLNNCFWKELRQENRRNVTKKESGSICGFQMVCLFVSFFFLYEHKKTHFFTPSRSPK